MNGSKFFKNFSSSPLCAKRLKISEKSRDVEFIARQNSIALLIAIRSHYNAVWAASFLISGVANRELVGCLNFTKAY
jgi:hypothetical protein